MANYSHRSNNTNPLANKGGYKDVFKFAPKADFTSVAAPTASPSAIGDKVKITTAHTFTGTKGFYNWPTKQQSVTIKSTTVGDPGARLLKHTAEFTILGDNASTQEQVESLLNDEVIALFKDSACVAGEYVQLGDDCSSPVFNVEFDGKTTAEGMKEYKVSVEVTASKYFYSGAIVDATA